MWTNRLLMFPRFAKQALPGRLCHAWIAACALILVSSPVSGAGPIPKAPQKQGDLASQVRAIFAARCAECHGPELRRPHGRFGYVLDLGRVAGNPKLVLPFRPAESRLWTLIRDDEMPPADARQGPLTAEQKGVIRAWISSGAPAESSPASPQPSPSISPVEEGAMSETFDRPLGPRILRWLGKFHILVIHFPIALLLAAAVGEAWRMGWRLGSPWPAVRFCVLLGAAGAVAAAVLGWFHADWGGYGAGSPEILGLHRWLGTAAALWAVGIALLSERDTCLGRRSLTFRMMLLLGTLLMGAVGHLGGTLVHGEEFFNW
jgi:mono/diheme cytochrome c family protein